MIISQNNKCFICGKDGFHRSKYGNTSLHLDHCHTTGKARKLLCMRCNLAVGVIEKGDEYASKVRQYIEGHKQSDVRTSQTPQCVDRKEPA
jgi:hypothetical protein